MRYPFQPEFLDTLPEELAELYRDLETTLLEEICSRLKLADQLNEVTVQDIRALRSHGISLEEIEKEIQNTARISQKKLKKLLDDVVARNQQYYREVIDLAGLTQPETLVSVEDTWAIYEQTKQTFRNLTRSMGFLVDNGRMVLPPARAYQWALDRAEMEVMSGAISYNQAISGAVKQLADGGLRVVDYESGHRDHIDVAARRAVMTGVSQLCAKYTEQSAEYLGTPHFEVSAHNGARDTGVAWQNHKAWQGRVYSTRTGDKYPSIYEVCGLGYVDGLEGANCRHRRYPFVDGVSERTYTDEQLAHIDDHLGCEYEGRHYTAYEATQQQRRIERTVRAIKRRKVAQKAAGLAEDATATQSRINRLTKKYREFSKAAGLPLQMDRMRIIDKGNYAKPPTAHVPPTVQKNLPLSGQKEKYTDVTAQWRETATPNSHQLQDLQEYTTGGVTYKVDGHNVVLDYSPHEKEIAELLEREFGGELYMVPRVNNPQGISTPDYLFRGNGYDLKTIGEKAGPNTIFNRIKKAAKQAQNFIVDVSISGLSDKEVDKQIEKLFDRADTGWLEKIIVVRDNRIVKVVKRA